jgi:hypothetical protein
MTLRLLSELLALCCCPTDQSCIIITRERVYIVLERPTSEVACSVFFVVCGYLGYGTSYIRVSFVSEHGQEIDRHTQTCCLVADGS